MKLWRRFKRYIWSIYSDPEPKNLVWTTTADNLRMVAQRMDDNNSITGEGTFHYIQAVVPGDPASVDPVTVKIYKLGF